MYFKTLLLSIILVSFSPISFGQPPYLEIGSDNLSEIALNKSCDIYLLKKSYYQYLYLIEKNVLLKQKKKLLKNLTTYSKLAYETGEISFQEKEEYNLFYYDIEMQINSLSYEISIAENNIKSVLDTVLDIVPLNDSLAKYISFEIIEFQESQIINIPDSNLTDFLMMENMFLNLRKKEDQISFCNKTEIPYIKILERNAKIQTENEDIDISDFLNIVNNIYERKNRILNILNEYNQLAIEIEKHYEEYNL